VSDTSVERESLLKNRALHERELELAMRRLRHVTQRAGIAGLIVKHRWRLVLGSLLLGFRLGLDGRRNRERRTR
jgi:hypothetical protein